MSRTWFKTLLGVLCVLSVWLPSIRLSAQDIEGCFEQRPVLGFPQSEIGPNVKGSSRVVEDRVEICSLTSGYGGTLDSLLSLTAVVPTEFEMTVEVVGIDGVGEAGLEARAFSGTGADPQESVLWIAVRKNDNGAVSLRAGFRLNHAEAMVVQSFSRVDLPVTIGIKRDGGTMSTYSLQGGAAGNVLSVTLAGTGLDVAGYRVGMVHGSDARSQTFGTGRFRNPDLDREQSVNPPDLALTVGNFHTTPDQPTVLQLTGGGLGQTRAVTVAGIQAEILKVTENTLEVKVPATEEPISGDIEVTTAGGTTVLPNSFFSFGESFIRCDCDGNGDVNIGDALAMLFHQFLGGRPCKCSEAGDCNDDDERNIADPLAALILLFLTDRPLPAQPYPNPGTDPRAPMCGIEDQVPTITGISQSQIQEGDVFKVFGRGFSSDPKLNNLVLGSAMLEVLDATETQLTVQAGLIVGSVEADLGIIRDFSFTKNFTTFSTLCRPLICPTLIIGPINFLLADERLQLIGSEVSVLATTSQNAQEKRGQLVLELDRERFNPNVPLNVIANIVMEPIANVSPGSRSVTFQLNPPARSTTIGRGPGNAVFRKCVLDLADKLRLELAGGGALNDLEVLPHLDAGVITVSASDKLPIDFGISGHISVYPGTVGRCGPTNTHPINDEREHGWCRFEELVDECNGLPQFEWFIPVSYVTSVSGSLVGVPHPNDRSPSEKSVMYNWSAYCHVRQNDLWNQCDLEDLVNAGDTEIPDFPIPAWVLKTDWRSDSQIPAGVDKTKLYSYNYSGANGGTAGTYYLTALHHTTKDLDKWFWFDAYPPEQVLTGGFGAFQRGVGGCGGTDVDAQAWTVGTIWENYFLCTNVTDTQPISTSGVDGVGPTATEHSAWCGNFEFAPECPDSIDAANLTPANDGFTDDTCLNCHDGAMASTGSGSIKVDFLFSLDSPTADPNPCSSGASVMLSTDVQPIFNSNCSCHTSGSSGGLSLAIGSAHGNIVNQPSSQLPSMDRIEPNDPNNSYLWRKINNTHVAAGGSGCSMPYDCSVSPSLLSATDLTTIETWINSGAPNN
jgi:hypothetical protein